MRCAVIGAGAWGTALANLLAENGHAVQLWAREADVVSTVRERRENATFLPGVTLAASLGVTDDQQSALRGTELVVYAAPSQHLRQVVRAGASAVAPSAVIAVASKGIEQGSLALMSDVVEEELGGRAVVAVSGPSFAAEVAAHEPTAIVAASQHSGAARTVQSALSSSFFRVYTRDDIIGVEVGGSMKNVMAVATGILEGVGLGHNARAALITRGLAEITRLGISLGARASTFAGLAGIGDLVLTCTGALSRNRAVGLDVGKGMTLDQALAGKQTVAEGVATTRSAYALAQRKGVEMPITTMVHRILFDGHPARDAVPELMTRGLRSEIEA